MKTLANVCIELEQGIERHELNAGAFKNLFTRHAREDLLHYALRPFIAITDRQFDELASRIDQSIIDAPAIDANALKVPAELASALPRLSQSLLNLIENLWEVPPQMPCGFGRWILKPAYFLKQHSAGVETGKKNSAAARAEIYSDVEGFGHSVYRIKYGYLLGVRRKSNYMSTKNGLLDNSRRRYAFGGRSLLGFVTPIGALSIRLDWINRPARPRASDG
jgi:hypothetical protein